MAKAKKKVNVPAERPAPQDSTEYWQNLLGTLEGGDSQFIFLKPGKKRLRLLSPEDHPPYHREVTTEYMGRKRTKYMTLAWAPQDEEDETPVKGLLMAKTVWKGIVTLQAEGYELFHPEEGHGITIVRSGAGLDTDYTVLPSKQAVEVPDEVLEFLDTMDLDDVVSAYEEFSANRGSDGDSGGANEDSGQSGDW